MERVFNSANPDWDVDPSQDPLDSLEDIRLGRWQDLQLTARFANWLYAQAHGYDITYIDAPDRTGTEQATRLVSSLTDQLKCCCPWVLWLDHTMLIRMAAHNVSIKSWLQSHVQDGDSGAPFAQKLLSEMSPHLEEVMEPVIGIVSTAGDEGHQGNFEIIPSTEHPAISTSMLLLARTNLTATFLDVWASAMEAKLEPALQREHSTRLKEALNQVAYARFIGDFWSLPFNEIGSPGSHVITKLPLDTAKEANVLSQFAASLIKSRRAALP
ncbi:hypothetical protein WJX74_004065 [Apatococcus lobatus]